MRGAERRKRRLGARLRGAHLGLRKAGAGRRPAPGGQYLGLPGGQISLGSGHFVLLSDFVCVCVGKSESKRGFGQLISRKMSGT